MKMKILYLETGRYKTAIRADGLVFMGHPPEAASFVGFAEKRGAIVHRFDGTAYVNVDWLAIHHSKDLDALNGLAMAVKDAHETAKKQPGFLH